MLPIIRFPLLVFISTKMVSRSLVMGSTISDLSLDVRVSCISIPTTPPFFVLSMFPYVRVIGNIYHAILLVCSFSQVSHNM